MSEFHARVEPQLPYEGDDDSLAVRSIAVSLKRIADRMQKPPETTESIKSGIYSALKHAENEEDLRIRLRTILEENPFE